MALKINQTAWVAPCKNNEKTVRVAFLSSYEKDGAKHNEAPCTFFARVSEKINLKNINLPEKGKFMEIGMTLSDYKKEGADDYQTSAFIYSLKAVEKKENSSENSSDAPF